MQSTSSPDNASKEALLQSFKDASGRARRREWTFWLFSLTFLTIVVVLGLLFYLQLKALEELQTQLGATRQQQAAMLVKNRLFTDIVFMWSAENFDALSEEYKEKMADTLGRNQVARGGLAVSGKLSEPERTFLEKFNDNSTPPSSVSYEEAFRRGSAALSAGDSQAAINLFEQAVSSEADRMSAQLGLGKAYFDQGRLEDAIDAFDDSIDDGAGAVGFTWRCRTENRLGVTERDPEAAARRFQGALADCARAIELDPDYWWSYNTRGFTNLLAGRYAEAESDWRAAALRISTPSYALENIVLVYLSTEQWEKTVEHTETFNRDYGTESAWNWFARWVAADQLKLIDQANKAQEEWKRLRTASSESGLIAHLPSALHTYLDPSMEK